MDDTLYTQPPLTRAGTFTSKGWHLSRRGFLGVAATGLLTACSSSHAPSLVTPPAASPTQTVLLPREPISRSNAAQVQKLAVLNVKVGRVRGLAWSPDGRTLAVGTWGAVQLWDVVTARQRATLRGTNSSAQVYQLSWSADGQLLAAGVDDNTVRIWDTRSHELRQTLRGTASVVLSVAWSPRGDRLAAGNSDGTVQIWERATWHQSGAWNDPATPGPFIRGSFPEGTYTAAWSLDGTRLAATRYDGYVRIWESHAGKLLHVLSTSNQPNGVSWSPTGYTLASSSDDGTIQLWDTDRYVNTRTLTGETQGGWAFAIPWSPDGHLMACSRDGNIVLIWDVQAGKVLNVLNGQASSIWTAAWSPDGLRIASGCDDETVYLWGVR